MIEELKKLICNSYAPYSNMHFACIVETKSGNFYKGVNVENASYGATICAERNAINACVAAGDTNITALYLMTDANEICYPCHLCKQVFTEFMNDKVIFNIMNTKGDNKVLTYKEVMNTIFSKDDVL